jgi:hypothetical protein
MTFSCEVHWKDEECSLRELEGANLEQGRFQRRCSLESDRSHQENKHLERFRYLCELAYPPTLSTCSIMSSSSLPLNEVGDASFSWSSSARILLGWLDRVVRCHDGKFTIDLRHDMMSREDSTKNWLKHELSHIGFQESVENLNVFELKVPDLLVNYIELKNFAKAKHQGHDKQLMDLEFHRAMTEPLKMVTSLSNIKRQLKNLIKEYVVERKTSFNTTSSANLVHDSLLLDIDQKMKELYGFFSGLHKTFDLQRKTQHVIQWSFSDDVIKHQGISFIRDGIALLRGSLGFKPCVIEYDENNTAHHVRTWEVNARMSNQCLKKLINIVSPFAEQHQVKLYNTSFTIHSIGACTVDTSQWRQQRQQHRHYHHHQAKHMFCWIFNLKCSIYDPKDRQESFVSDRSHPISLSLRPRTQKSPS